LIKDGDTITIDASTGEINVDLSQKELAERKAEWSGRDRVLFGNMLSLWDQLRRAR